MLLIVLLFKLSYFVDKRDGRLRGQLKRVLCKEVIAVLLMINSITTRNSGTTAVTFIHKKENTGHITDRFEAHLPILCRLKNPCLKMTQLGGLSFLSS